MSPQVYLLAAGRGRRAGGPKAWRDCDGKPLLERQLEFLTPRFDPVITIQPDWAQRCAGLAPGASWVPVDPEASPLASLQAALRQAPMTGWSFLYHVDMRVWEPGLFTALAAGAVKTKAEAVIPTFAGRRGHPVLLSPVLTGDVLALDPEHERLDSFLRTREVETLETDFVCVLDNWNSPPDGTEVSARRSGTETA